MVAREHCLSIQLNAENGFARRAMENNFDYNVIQLSLRRKINICRIAVGRGGEGGKWMEIYSESVKSARHPAPCTVELIIIIFNRQFGKSRERATRRCCISHLRALSILKCPAHSRKRFPGRKSRRCKFLIPLKPSRRKRNDNFYRCEVGENAEEEGGGGIPFNNLQVELPASIKIWMLSINDFLCERRSWSWLLYSWMKSLVLITQSCRELVFNQFYDGSLIRRFRNEIWAAMSA